MRGRGSSVVRLALESVPDFRNPPITLTPALSRAFQGKGDTMRGRGSSVARLALESVPDFRNPPITLTPALSRAIQGKGDTMRGRGSSVARPALESGADCAAPRKLKGPRELHEWTSTKRVGGGPLIEMRFGVEGLDGDWAA
jgi:hypothetical protein